MSMDKKKIIINSMEDILASLDGGDPSIVVAVLRAIALDPSKALSYENNVGRDLPKELAKRFHTAKGNIFKTGFFAAMVAIDAPEYLDEYKKGFFMSECPEIMLASASKLADRQEGEVRDFLATALFNDAMPKQAQLAANVMTRFAGLDATEAIRVGLLANREDVVTPAFGEETQHAWIAELCGPLQAEARMVLEHACGESGFRLFKAQWSELPQQVRTWVLEWGAREHPVYVLDLLADSLNSANRELKLAALSGLETRPEFANFMKDKIEELVHSDDSLLHIAALRALPETSAVILEEVAGDPHLLLIALQRLPARIDHKELLFELLDSDRWEVRSLATRKIMELGAAGADHARGINQTELSLGTKVALSKILMVSGHEEMETASEI
jgi:hypothetical protein